MQKQRRKPLQPLTLKRVEKLLRNGTAGRYLDKGDGRSGNQSEPIKGLYLVVASRTAAHWELRYQLHNRSHQLGLGSARDFSLTEARARAKAARQKLADKVDPIEAKREALSKARREAIANTTFKEVALDFLRVHDATWKNDKHRAQWASTLRLHAFPTLGHMSWREIQGEHITAALSQVHAKTPETASRTRQRIERVMQWATAGKPMPKTRRKEKRPSLPYNQIQTFLAELRLRQAKSVAAYATEFMILTATRSIEVRGARQSEIDLDNKTWTIPAERMKMGIEHRVPLTDRAIEILRNLPTERGNDLIFLGAKSGKPLSDMALVTVLRRMNAEREHNHQPLFVDLKQGGKPIVPHGFRSTFRTWATEVTDHGEKVAEIALAHGQKGIIAAYQRGDMFEKRRRLMLDWERFCNSPPRPMTAEIIPLHQEARA